MLDWAWLEPVVKDGSLNWWWCASTLAYAVLCAVLLLFRVVPQYQTFKRLRSALPASTDPKAFAERFETYREIVLGEPTVRHSWAEFSESLVLPRDGDLPRIRNTREPSYFFNDATLIEPVVHGRFFDSVPGHLVGLGILGTFIGLAAGIGIASKDLHHDDVEKLKLALGTLLDGASMAFITSIFGLGLSLLFVSLDRYGLGKLRRSLLDWVDALEARLELVTPEQVALEQLHEAKRQTAQLERFNNDLAFSLEKALDEAVAAKLGPQLEAIVAAVDRLRDDRADWSLQAMEELIGQFSEAVTQGAGRELQALAVSVGGATKDMRATLEGTVESNRVAQEKLTQAAGALEEAAARGGEQLSQRLESAAAALAQQLEVVASSFAQRIGEAAERIRAAGVEAAERLSALSDHFTSVVEQLTGLATASSERTKELQEIAERLGLVAADWLTAHERAQSLLEPVQAMVRSLESAGDRVAASTSTIEPLVSQAAAAANALAEQHARIVESWESYRERFEGVDRALEGTFRQLVEGTGHYSEQVKTFVESLDKQMATAIDRLGAGTTRLTEAVEDLAETLETNRT